MSISDEAVEAAAKVIALSTGHIMESDWEWEHLPKEGYYKTARAALEAAAPHMYARALEEAIAAFPLETIMAPDNAVVWMMRRAEELRTNPHRSQP